MKGKIVDLRAYAPCAQCFHNGGPVAVQRGKVNQRDIKMPCGRAVWGSSARAYNISVPRSQIRKCRIVTRDEGAAAFNELIQFFELTCRQRRMNVR